MSENIIERAAIAITPGWKTASKNTKRNARITVAAVLEVLREPAPYMMVAARCHQDSDSSNYAWWQAMIDAALADKPV